MQRIRNIWDALLQDFRTEHEPLAASPELPNLKDKAVAWLLECPSAHQYQDFNKDTFAVQLVNKLCTQWRVKPVFLLGFLICGIVAILLALFSLLGRFIRQQLSCAAILCFLLGLKYSAALASDKTGAGPVLQHIHI
eukprot:scaffold78690_cov21-Tisochrysis_lutea.AAC.3